MSTRASEADRRAVDVREATDIDEPRVLELLLGVFGEWPGELAGVTPSEFFHWKHKAGSFGRSRLLIAEHDQVIVGFTAYMPWRFRAGEQTMMSARAVDLAVDRSYRRLGASVAIRSAANTYLASETGFIWGNPNEQSHPGGRTTGASDAATILHFMRPGGQWGQTLRRAAAQGRRTPPAMPIEVGTAAEALREGAPVTALLEAIPRDPSRLSTDIDLDYLRWRYGHFAEYRAVTVHSGSELLGLAIFRARRHGPFWGSDICELLVAGGTRRTARRLVAAVRRAAPGDFLSCACRSKASAAAWGFLPSGRGTTLTTVPLHPGLLPDPAGLDSWALSRGDLEML
jgi:hypothetical protein